MSFIQKLFGSKNQRELKKMHPAVQKIADLGAVMEAKSDSELRGMTGVFRERLSRGATLDELLPEAFAVTREAAWRVMGMRHYDVQLMGGMVMHSGRIAEMRTGEGKTLTATAPAYLNALENRGVHVVTVNDYLASRDAEWMGQVYRFLGLSVGCIVHGLDDFERQRNYGADITYGQNSEFGFDYLRDNMKMSPDRMVQRGLRFAIVDEVDSILIDEARTPLIISGPAERSADLYQTVDKVVPRLKRDIDYTVDEKAHSAMLTDQGNERIEELMEVENLYDSKNLQLIHHVNQALKAHTLYKRDVNYLVDDGKVVIIDEFTGRKMPGRRWSDGLHQAIEAKEGATIEEENQTLATVTYQNFFRMYDKLSGMTGTADTEAAEFHHIYKLDVIVVPTNKPMVRDDQPDLIYKNEKGKFKAVFADILESHERGQPVLVGTTSVEKSEVLAKLLTQKDIAFEVLNAKQHEREAGVVAQAGRKGAITISTNMAGRGTDILLGGNAEALAEAEAGPDASAEEVALVAERFRRQCAEEKKEVLEAGGLKIIGTERHESRRIDNQLRGRAGRQGDPGASRFYLSLEDDLMRIFGAERITNLMERLGMEEDVPIEHSWVTRAIENAQKKVEGHNFDSRKNVLEYDDVMNQQRKTIYSLRKQILRGEYVPTLSEDEVKAGRAAPQAATHSGDWTVESVSANVRDEIARLVGAALVQEKERGLLADERKSARSAEGGASGGVDDDESDESDESDDDESPTWRLLRNDVWRQTGAWLEDLKADFGRPRDELVQFISDAAARSLIQQRERLYDLCDTRIGALIEAHCPADNQGNDWDLEALETALQEQFNLEIKLPRKNIDPQNFAENTWKLIEKRLDERLEELGRSWLMYFARHFYLEEIDQQWIEHLKGMDYLREGIGLRGYGQKDPKKEYKKEGFDLFSLMMLNIEANTAQKIFRVQIQPRETERIPELKAKSRPTIERHPEAGDDAATGGAATEGAESAAAGDDDEQRTAGTAGTAKVKTVRRERPKVGRNDPCPCGSGKKFKKCHGSPGSEAAV